MSNKAAECSMEGIGLQVNELVNDVKGSNNPGTCRTKCAHNNESKKNESKNKQIHLLQTLFNAPVGNRLHKSCARSESRSSLTRSRRNTGRCLCRAWFDKVPVVGALPGSQGCSRIEG